MVERFNAVTEQDLLAFLREHQIPFHRTEHPPVYTCEEAQKFRPEIAGLETKNLFLRDERRSFYLVMTGCARRLNLRAFGREIGAPKLHFGSPEDLLACLGLTPGAVTVLGLVNDTRHCVELLVDDLYWPSPAYLCHPLVNTATLVLEHAALLRFLSLTGHQPRVVTIPGQAAG
jgi:Ala-tRNA(Pro) deacylase